MKRGWIFSLVALAASCLPAAPATDDVAVLQERFLKERRPADKKAWYAACERAGVDVTKRKRSAVDARGIYKFNRESRLACISLGRDAAPAGNWTEPLGADGELHVEWTRKPNGGIDCRHTAPTNWDVFVTAWPGPVTRYGFTVLKEKTGTHPRPKVVLPPGWRVVWDEKHSDVNVREAYVLVETDATNAPAPKVTFEWPEAGVRRVLGPTKGHAPRNMTTSFPREGSLGFSVTHHIRGTQAGPHRRSPYPEREIASGFNFLFALRDGFRLLGFGRDGALKGGTVVLAGFDSHYPNGHTDFPAHFHIMNNCRDGNQVSHFYMDPKSGRLTEDCFQDMNRPADCWDRVYRHRPGDSWEMYDGFADVAYTVTMLKDGTGLEIATTNGAFRVVGERPCERVRLSVREGSAWRFVKTLAVRDDPVRGETVTPDGVIRYDPDTFEFREFRPATQLGRQRLFTMRFDDNHSPAQWKQVADAFERHGLRASFAVTAAGLSDEQGACLAELARRGHEIMDQFIYISHMNGARAGGWDKWLADTEAFAAWLASSDINVVTYSEQARRLFGKDK